MKDVFYEIIEKYQKEVKKYNESTGKEKITDIDIAIKAMFETLNLIAIQNDIIIKLLAVERTEKSGNKQ